MIDNFVSKNRGSQRSSEVNYRPDGIAYPSRRAANMSEIVQKRTNAALPAESPAPQIAPKPMVNRGFEFVTPKPEVAAVPKVEIVPPVILEEPPIVAEPPVSKEAPVEENTQPLKRKKGRLRYISAIVGAVIILGITGYISIDAWMTNNEVKQVVAQRDTQNTASATTVLGEGQDETEVTKDTIGSYKVAADLPRVITVDKLKIHARVMPMSVNADGSLQAPANIYDSGWYSASSKPGTPGAALIDAHASGATREGLFAYLDTLAAGDQISIERGNGEKLTYKVAFKETVPLESVDMVKLLNPYGGAAEGLNLITCTGKWLPDQKTYDHRVTVYAQRVL